jgi:hypothetical protein
MKVVDVVTRFCKKKLYVSTFCIGVELNQFFPLLVEVVTGEKLIKEFKDENLFCLDSKHSIKENAFSKQKLNYGRRKRHQH